MLVQSPPQGQEWFYEVKFDGYRCLAGRDTKGVTLWSRRENLFTKQFPQIAKACERLPPTTLLDGEIVALDEKGRVSFNLLQHHRSKAQALVFYAFMFSYIVGEVCYRCLSISGGKCFVESLRITTLLRLAYQKTLKPHRRISCALKRGLDLKESSPSARTQSMSQANEAAHGSSTRSTEGRSLSSVVIRRAIRLM